MRIRALTLWEPWASLMALGVKQFETRSWAPRGLEAGDLVVVTAAKRWAEEQWGAWERLGRKHPSLQEVFWPIIDFKNWRDGPPTLGHALSIHEYRGHGVSDGMMIRVESERLLYFRIPEREQELGDYRRGRYAWYMPVTQRLKPPVPVTGRQGLWTPPPGIRVAGMSA